MNIANKKWCGLLSVVLCAPAFAQTAVGFDASTPTGVITPLLFGANHRYGLAGSGGSDPTTGITYPALVSQIVDAKISMLRFPGGTMANTYHWANAIGPQAQRQLQVNGNVSVPVPIDSTFGPDEYGNMLDQTGATGDLMLNFATESSKDAAHFVAYMTAPQGSGTVDGVDWAALRASNGHTAPYNVSYAEVGNEYYYTAQQYWITGTPVTINASCSPNPLPCLYTYGGSTSFTSQAAVQLDNWQSSASNSTGAAGQSFYARYSPVVSGSQTVYVKGTAWTPVASLTTAGPSDHVYVFNNTTGQILFGDGTHGAIPASGSAITVTYVSGPHDGFANFYSAVKAVNPNIKVCTSLNSSAFLQILGSTVPYDCVIDHAYASLPTAATTLDDLFGGAMLTAGGLGSSAGGIRTNINTYAGSNAANIQIILSEYGIDASEPALAPNFMRSLAAAIFDGLALRSFMLNPINGAERHTLIDYTFGAPPVNLGVSNFDNVLIGGPGPQTVETPSALAIKLFAKNSGPTRIKNFVTGNVTRTLTNGSTLNALVPIASKDSNGNAYLIVINEDRETPVTATVEPQNFTHGTTATVETLGSTSITDENNPTSPTTVQLVDQPVAVGTGNFSWTFPAHSITAIHFSN